MATRLRLEYQKFLTPPNGWVNDAVKNGRGQGLLPFFFFTCRRLAMSPRPHAHSVVIGLRLSEQGFTKLNTLAKRTGRTRAAVLRYLIDLAEATNLPDIRFRDEHTSDTGAQ